MPQVTPERPPQDARDALHRHIRTTVAVSALRKIRRLVDEYHEEQRLNAKLSRWVVIGSVLAVAGLAAVLYFSGAALPRLLTGLLGLLKG